MATGRGHAQTLRLSLIYSLMDGSEVVKVEHLEAALAVWQYCQHSARIIFGKAPEVTERGREERDEPLDFRLLLLIEKNPGVKRADLVQALPSNKRGLAGEALAGLQARGLAHPRMEATAGRKAECWYPGRMPEGPDDGEGDDPPAGCREDMEGKLPGLDLSSIPSTACTADVHGRDVCPTLPSIPSISSASMTQEATIGVMTVVGAKAPESQHEARLPTTPSSPPLSNQGQQAEGEEIPQAEGRKRDPEEPIPEEHFDIMLGVFIDDMACRPVSEHARKLCEEYDWSLSPAFGSRASNYIQTP